MEVFLGLWGRELSLVLLLDGLHLLSHNIFLLFLEEERFSILSHILEFKVDS